MASRGSKIALAGTSLFALSTIIIVHFQQRAEQSVCSFGTHHFDFPFHHEPLLNPTNVPAANIWCPGSQAMHQGVVRDMEQQRIKRERQLDFDLQKQLEAEYRQEQTVRSSVEPNQPQAGLKK